MPRLPLRPWLLILCDLPAPPPGVAMGAWEAVWRRARADLDASVNDRGASLGDMVLHVGAAAGFIEVEQRGRAGLDYGMNDRGEFFDEGPEVEQLRALVDAPPDDSVWCLWARGPRWFVAPVRVVERRTRESGELEVVRARWRDEAREREAARRPWLGQVVTPRHLRTGRARR